MRKESMRAMEVLLVWWYDESDAIFARENKLADLCPFSAQRSAHAATGMGHQCF